MKLFALFAAAHAGCAATRRSAEIDCKAFMERHNARGPRPDYDDYPIGDMPPEEAQSQLRICEEQLAEQQRLDDQEHGLDDQLQAVWVNTNWDQIKITLDECDTWRSNRGSRPEFEDDKLTKKDKVYTLDNMSHATIIAYCDELERRTEEAVADLDSASSSSSSSSSDESDKPFPERMYKNDEDEPNPSITDMTICTKHPNVCCPLFEADAYNVDAFPNETINALNEEQVKSECAKYEFMPCCVFADLCNIYADLVHCQEANQAAMTEELKLLFSTEPDFRSSASTTSSTSTPTSTTSTTITTTSTPKVVLADTTADSRIVSDLPDAGRIIGGNVTGTNAGSTTPSPEEINNMNEDAAKRGITILLVVIGLILLMAIIALVARHYLPASGAEADGVVAGEDDSLLVTNKPDAPLEQVPEETPEQMSQQHEQQQVQQQQQAKK